MENMILKGSVHKYGANVNTDEIIPARYLTTSDPKELAKYCMKDIDDNFAQTVKIGDVIVADKNFGCGSSREHAPISIKGAGVSCVIAKSFARIFFRNSINIGLPIIESEEAVDNINDGDKLEIDLAKGEIKNITTKQIYKAQPFPEFMQKLIKSGGLLSYIKGEK